MNEALVIMSLVNIMVGKTFVFPQVYLSYVGLVWVVPIIFAVGFICTYSCYLYVLHLGNHSDFDSAIQYHFWDSKTIRTFYNVFFFLIIFYDLIIIFEFIIIVWNDKLDDETAIFVSIGTCILLFLYVCLLKYFNISGQILAYGFLLLVIFCIFVIYLIASAPRVNVQIPLYGPDVSLFMNQLGIFFEIQPFLMPLLMNLSTKSQASFIKCIIISFAAGCSILTFLIVGAPYGLYTRSDPHNAQTIFAFFAYNRWESWFIVMISWLANIMIFGQVAIIVCQRFFSIFKTYCTIRERNEKQFFTPPEIGFMAALHIVLAAFVVIIIYLGKSGEIGEKAYKWQNGILIVVGFILFFLLPAIIQFKCLYFPRLKPVFVFQQKESQPLELKEKLLNQHPSQKGQEGPQFIKTKSDQSQKCENIKLQKQILIKPIKHQNEAELNRESAFQRQIIGANLTFRIQRINEACPAKIPEGWWRVLDIVSLFLMITFGVFLMVLNITKADYFT